MSQASDIKAKNRRTLTILLGVAVGMFGFGFAMVPLYGFLCQVTGVQSIKQQAAMNTKSDVTGISAIADRWITVKFDGTVHPDLPWTFEPMERKIQVRPGETTKVNFIAVNRSSKEVTGQALPSIVPWQANAFFNKLECFCFRQQTLTGGERKEMPLQFVVSPGLPDKYASLTLSYNFMRIADKEEPNQVVMK